MSDWGKDWIIAVANSEADGVAINRFYGTEEEVRALLVRMVQEDRKNDEESFEYGTEEPENVDNTTGSGTLNASATYSNYHIDYTAKEWAYVDHIK